MVSETTLIKVQNLTGLLFSVYLIMHLTNNAAAIISQDLYDNMQTVLRKFYQTPAVELTMIIGAWLTHSAVSSMRVARRWTSSKYQQQGQDKEKKSMKTSVSVTLHRITGLILGAMVPLHFFATRLEPWLNQSGPSNFAHLFETVSKAPVVMMSYFALYYSAATYHTIGGLAKVFGLRDAKTNAMTPLQNLLGVLGVVVAVTCSSAFVGWLYPVKL